MIELLVVGENHGHVVPSSSAAKGKRRKSAEGLLSLMVAQISQTHLAKIRLLTIGKYPGYQAGEASSQQTQWKSRETRRLRLEI